MIWLPLSSLLSALLMDCNPHVMDCSCTPIFKSVLPLELSPEPDSLFKTVLNAAVLFCSPMSCSMNCAANPDADAL